MMKHTILISRTALGSLAALPAEDLKIIIGAMNSYAFDPENEQNFSIPAHLSFGWGFVKNDIDIDNKRFLKVREARSAAGKKSAEAKKSESLNTSASTKKLTKSTKSTSNSNSNSNSNRDSNSNSNRDSNILSLQTSGTDIKAAAEHHTSFSAADAERELLSIPENISMIIEAYPRCRQGNRKQLFKAVERALKREMQQGNIPCPRAVEILYTGTCNYSRAVALWDDKRFVSDPVKFYDQGKYLYDPAVWIHDPPSAAGCKFDPLKPETWGGER